MRNRTIDLKLKQSRTNGLRQITYRITSWNVWKEEVKITAFILHNEENHKRGLRKELKKPVEIFEVLQLDGHKIG